MKTCGRCKQTKELEAFYKRGDSSKGYRSVCKPCHTRIDPLLKQKAGAKKRLSAEQTRLSRLETFKRYRQRNKHKHAAYVSKQRAHKLNATPKWLSKEQMAHIQAIYKTAQDFSEVYEQKFHVDHIIPLKGKDVCGLHVPWNLQLMAAEANIKKGNRYEA